MIEVESPNHALHEEVLVKVNAYVDEGIAPLVEVLNTFAKVQTFESCQGRDGMVDGLALLQMTYGNSKDTDLAEVAAFANRPARLFALLPEWLPSDRHRDVVFVVLTIIHQLNQW